MPQLGMRQLDSQQLFLTSVYLMVLGLLLGYMAENQKKLRAERAVITRVLGSTRVEAGLTAHSAGDPGGNPEHLRRAPSDQCLPGSEQLPRLSRGAQSQPGRPRHPALARSVPGEPGSVPVRLAGGRAVCGSALPTATTPCCSTGPGCASATWTLGISRPVWREWNRSTRSRRWPSCFGREWSGRVFLFDPEVIGNREEELHFLQEFSQQVGPAIYNVYLIRRLRERAGRGGTGSVCARVARRRDPVTDRR